MAKSAKGFKNHIKVIPSAGSRWTFWDYVPGKNNPIQEWYDGLGFEAQTLFDAVLENCSKTENPNNWSGFKRFLKGAAQAEKIWELEFRADKRQYRIFGIYGNERRQAILLAGCYHKQRVYTPPNVIDTACKRAKDYKAGKGGLRERPIEADI